MNPTNSIQTEYLPIELEEKFGGVRFLIPVTGLYELGFSLGDSVDISFSDGRVLERIPLLNGYYVQPGELLLSAYPNFIFPCLFYNARIDTWERLGMTCDIRAMISLNKKAEFLSLQETFNLLHSNKREDFASDEIYSNYRDLTIGDIKPGRLIRCASACNNMFSRVPVVNHLMKRDKVRAILDLADTPADIQLYQKLYPDAFPFFEKLYKNGAVMLLATNNALELEVFQKTLVKGLRFLLKHDTPWLLFCSEGKDRTGIYSMLLGALCGASLEELEKDYMETYNNYYFITREKRPETYRLIKEHYFDNIMDAFAKSVGLASYKDLTDENLSKYTEIYLNNAGLGKKAIALIRKKLTQ